MFCLNGLYYSKYFCRGFPLFSDFNNEFANIKWLETPEWSSRQKYHPPENSICDVLAICVMCLVLIKSTAASSASDTVPSISKQ